MLKTIIPLTLASLLFIGCGSSSKSTKTIDILDYFPTENTTKSYMQLSTNQEEEKLKVFYTEEVSKEDKIISIKIDEKLDRTFTIHSESIIKQEYGIESNNIQMKRFISKGSTLYTLEKSTHNEKITLNDVIVGSRSIESKKVCKLDTQLDELDSYPIPYKDDILKFECVKKESIETKINEEWEGKLQEHKSGSIDSNYDLSYFYMKKGVGLIVDIDNNCYVKEDNIGRINDKSKQCDSKTSVHKFFL
ncbi:MAG: hypothetical protein KAG56_03090 [Sulfurovaceae bacterium]|nr:hypothetical protein [Sulfurovaceae bacterium]